MIRLGNVTVEIRDGYTLTTFADGTRLHALHAEQDGQRETALDLGYSTAWEMNVVHDLAHSLLARWLDLPHSPTLHAVARGMDTPAEVWRREEEAVLALQAYAKAVGVDLVAIARRMG
jgi:hypothetical protein